MYYVVVQLSYIVDVIHRGDGYLMQMVFFSLCLYQYEVFLYSKLDKKSLLISVSTYNYYIIFSDIIGKRNR